MAIRVYRRSKAIMIILLSAAALLLSAAIFCFATSSGILLRAGAAGMTALAIVCGISAITYRLIIGDEYIEEKDIRRKRIDFKDITSVAIDDQEAIVRSQKHTIRFPKDIFGFRGAIGQLMKAQDRFHFEVWGEQLLVKTAIYHARDPQESNPLDDPESTVLALDVTKLRSRLIRKGRVYRGIVVEAGDKKFYVQYDGTGNGYECVLVNGNVVAFKDTIFWYNHEFQFRIGTLPAIIKVKFWPWMYLRSITLEIGGRLIYSEPSDCTGSTPLALRAGK